MRWSSNAWKEGKKHRECKWGGAKVPVAGELLDRGSEQVPHVKSNQVVPGAMHCIPS